jgi:hypothetical protein
VTAHADLRPGACKATEQDYEWHTRPTARHWGIIHTGSFSVKKRKDGSVNIYMPDWLFVDADNQSALTGSEGPTFTIEGDWHKATFLGWTLDKLAKLVEDK